jgi:hypothetical protein
MEALTVVSIGLRVGTGQSKAVDRTGIFSEMSALMGRRGALRGLNTVDPTQFIEFDSRLRGKLLGAVLLLVLIIGVLMGGDVLFPYIPATIQLPAKISFTSDGALTYTAVHLNNAIVLFEAVIRPLVVVASWFGLLLLFCVLLVTGFGRLRVRLSTFRFASLALTVASLPSLLLGVWLGFCLTLAGVGVTLWGVDSSRESSYLVLVVSLLLFMVFAWMRGHTRGLTGTLFLLFAFICLLVALFAGIFGILAWLASRTAFSL